jgi:hypothetical protein
MTVHYIQFVETSFDRLAYRNKHWWDGLRWWLVGLLGGENPNVSVKVTRIPIDEKEFMARLWKQRRHLFDRFHREPKTLLIGAEDYEEMMDSPTIRQALRFEAEYNYGAHEVYGLKVMVIPWMRGAVVMP